MADVITVAATGPGIGTLTSAGSAAAPVNIVTFALENRPNFAIFFNPSSAAYLHLKASDETAANFICIAPGRQGILERGGANSNCLFGVVGYADDGAGNAATNAVILMEGRGLR